MRIQARGVAFSGSLLVLCLALRITATSQEKSWFDKNNRGNRYEGLVDRPNGLAEYKVLDLLGVTGEPHLGDSPELHILYYVPEGDSVATFRVDERVDETQYTMRPIQEPARQNQWNLFEHWPTRDVIVPNRVRPDNLGVLIRLKDARVPDLIAPAFLYASTRPAAFSRYSLHLYVERALRSLSCTVRDSDGNSTGAGKQPYSCKIVGRQPPTESSSILHFDILSSDLPGGLVTVHLSGRYANDESGARFNNDIHFYHQPPPIAVR